MTVKRYTKMKRKRKYKWYQPDNQTKIKQIVGLVCTKFEDSSMQVNVACKFCDKTVTQTHYRKKKKVKINRRVSAISPFFSPTISVHFHVYSKVKDPTPNGF